MGNANDLEQIVERDGDRLYRVALRITGCAEDAEAAIEAALRAAARTTDAADTESPLESRLYRAVARAAHDRRRRRRPRIGDMALERLIPVIDVEGHFEPMGDWSHRIDEHALDRRLHEVVMDAIDALPVDDRTALILQDLEGAPTADIAAILGDDVPTVKRRVHRARLFVRRRLSEYFESAGVA